MKKILWIMPLALGLGFGLGGCDEPGFISGSVTTTHRNTGYYDGDADFYYVDRTPYSRSYGPLVFRDNRYYYRQRGAYVVYDRPTRVWRDSDRHARVYREERREEFRDRRNDRHEDWHDRNDDRRDDYRVRY